MQENLISRIKFYSSTNKTRMYFLLTLKFNVIYWEDFDFMALPTHLIFKYNFSS